MKLTKYFKGLGFDVHQQNAYFGDLYRTTFEVQRVEQEVIQREIQKVTQDISYLPFLEPIKIKS